MHSFDYRVVISPDNKEDAKKILEILGSKAALFASWSWDGTMIEVDGFSDFDRLGTDKDYAHDKIVQAKETG